MSRRRRAECSRSGLSRKKEARIEATQKADSTSIRGGFGFNTKHCPIENFYVPRNRQGRGWQAQAGYPRDDVREPRGCSCAGMRNEVTLRRGCAAPMSFDFAQDEVNCCCDAVKVVRGALPSS